MKVKELIEMLQKVDPEKAVGLCCAQCAVEYGGDVDSGLYNGLELIESRGFTDPNTEVDVILIRDK